MTFKTHEIDVDLVNQISTKEIRFSDGDRNSAKLILNIKNEGEQLDLSKAKAVRITFKKQDGTTVFQEDLNPINAMEGKYQSILKTQTLAAAGNVYAQVRIFEEDRELDAEPFVFTVKQSYSGDGAVKSTNEYTIIAKALELGEKFKDVDFDPIIKAGELAANALPKTGGTINGDIKMTNGRSIRLQNAEDKTIMTLGSNSGGGFYSWSDVAAKGVFKYDPVTHFMEIQAGTNVYKKTDLYPNWLTSAGWSTQLAVKTDLNTITTAGIYSGYDLVNTPEAITQFFYVEVIPHYNNRYLLQRATALSGSTLATWQRRLDNSVWGAWVKQIDASGGTFDGHVTMGVDKDLVFKAKDSQFKLRGQLANNRLVLQSINAAGVDKFVLHYDSDTDTFNLNAANTNLVTKVKDSRATNIPPTIDAELTSSNGIIADRRGNTVTLRAQFRRRAGSTGSTVFTMPSGMRPTLSLYQNVVANDGTVGLLTIVPDGIVTLTTTGATNIAGKDINVVMTYAVD